MYFLHKINQTTFADKMKEDDIYDLIDRINALIELNIALARARLATMTLEVNKYMKMYNGNRQLKILYQNIPGTISKQNLIVTITSILDRLDPDVLAVAEPESSDMEIDWYPYKLVKGFIKNGTKSLH